MGLFNWAAPIFGHFADRWSHETIQEVAGWLAPFLTAEKSEDNRILDVGGGTGALARRLHQATSAQVTVVDPTPQMLRYIPNDGPIKAVLGTAEDMEFEDDSFDVVIVTDAFHHFRDQPAAVEGFRRVVRCGGGIVVVDLDPRGLIMRTVVLAERLLGEPGAFFTPEQMCAFMSDHGVNGECTKMGGAGYRFVGRVD